MELELENCALVTRDFVQTVKDNRQPAVTGESLLPAMRVLQIAQDNWDKKTGRKYYPDVRCEKNLYPPFLLFVVT